MRRSDGMLLMAAALAATAIAGCSILFAPDDPPPAPDPAFGGCFVGTDADGEEAFLVLEDPVTTGCLRINHDTPELDCYTLSGVAESSTRMTLTLTDSAGQDEITAILETGQAGDADDRVTLEGIEGDIADMTRDCRAARDDCTEVTEGCPG